MFKKIILNNGIPVVIETSKETLSICIGIWVKAGSRNETAEKNGISHFLEHMFFKGTAKRTSKDIAVEIDSLGGELNAFTSREGTTFYIKTLDEYIENAVELITDIFQNSIFPDEEINKEKNVIFEEIKMIEDTPEDYVHDLFNKSIWGDSGLGQPVIGNKDTIKTFKKDDLLEHIGKHYCTKDIVIAGSGNFDKDKLISTLNQSIGSMKRESQPVKNYCPEFTGNISIIPKKLSEVQLCFGIKGLPQASADRYSMHLLNTILGAGPSSRLFQEIREKRGLAYSTGSFNASFYDTGVWTVYAGTDAKKVCEVVDIIICQMKGLAASISVDELQKAKNQLKGNLVLALESTSSKMVNIAKQEIYYGKYFSAEDIINSVKAVTLDEVKDLSQRLVENSAFALTVYGPVDEKEMQKLELTRF